MSGREKIIEKFGKTVNYIRELGPDFYYFRTANNRGVFEYKADTRLGVTLVYGRTFVRYDN